MQTGHLPFLDQPEATGAVIREFLDTPSQTAMNEEAADSVRLEM